MGCSSSVPPALPFSPSLLLTIHDASVILASPSGRVGASVPCSQILDSPSLYCISNVSWIGVCIGV